MKKFYLLLLASVIISSCASVDENLLLGDNDANVLNFGKARKFQVSLKSAKYFADKIQFDDNVDRNVKNMEFITYGRDTLLYFVNYTDNNGWVVLSGDKRTEAILASSTVGEIDKNRLGGSATWLEDIAGKIYGLKQSNNEDTTAVNYAMWCKIDTLALGLREQVASSSSTRSTRGNVSPPPSKDIDTDEYREVLIDSKIEVTSSQSVGPLIQTKWGQGAPWNECTPFWQNTNERCPTGCVAVAGAQMLYYFHHLKDKPSAFYSQGRCIGRVFDKHNKYVSFEFSNPTTEVWSKMALTSSSGKKHIQEGTNLVALLMGYVGWKVNMEYGKNGSSAKTEDLVGLYREFGIDSEYEAYNPKYVRQSLDKNIPVNIRADSRRNKKKILCIIPIGWKYSGGHSWIIDGYTDKEIRYTYTYIRVRKYSPDEPAPVETPYLRSTNTPKRAKYALAMEKPYTTIEISRSYYWRMNFGWEGFYDDGDYLTGEDKVWNTDVGNFEYRKEIIHKFSF